MQKLKIVILRSQITLVTNLRDNLLNDFARNKVL